MDTIFSNFAANLNWKCLLIRDFDDCLKQSPQDKHGIGTSLRYTMHFVMNFGVGTHTGQITRIASIQIFKIKMLISVDVFKTKKITETHVSI